jgi:hypothetical protein
MIYFVAICFILWQFGILCGKLIYYPHFGILYNKKSGNPDYTEIPQLSVDNMYMQLPQLKERVCTGTTVLNKNLIPGTLHG